MVCYAVPALAAIVHFGLRKNVSSMKNSYNHFLLGLMLAGGAIFGIVDHLWNGELFLIGNNLISDLLLGTTITTVICIAWAVVIAFNRKSEKPVKTTQ